MFSDSSQSRSANCSAAVVPKVRTDCLRLPLDPGTRTQAATVCLCTSSPQTRSITRSMTRPSPGRVTDTRKSPVLESLLGVLKATMRGADGSHVRLFADSWYHCLADVAGYRRAVSIDDFHHARVCSQLMAIIQRSPKLTGC
jgi:hypothetical protein